jgi:hypothetical protein
MGTYMGAQASAHQLVLIHAKKKVKAHREKILVHWIWI